MGKAKQQLSLPGEFPPELSEIAPQLGERYRFDGPIAPGNNAMTYKICETTTNRPYCLKTLLPTLSGDARQRALATLKKEVDILLPISHAALPRVYDYSFTRQKTGFYVSNFHPGMTLLRFVENRKSLDPENSWAFLSLLFSAVELVHRRRRTHCDLHSKNLLLSENVLADGILIIDFGSGHRESDPETLTPNRGNRLFKLGPPTYGEEVDTTQHGDALRGYDFVALGHLLSQADSALFADAKHQKEALKTFYLNLITQRITTWRQLHKALSQVREPFKALNDIELVFFDNREHERYIPLPVSRTVRVSERILNVINSKPLQKLRGIRQLSFCDWYFPGATHTRFEHSLGTFQLVQSALRHLAFDSAFRDRYGAIDLRACLLAALLHDVGHYPFAHMCEHYAFAHFPEKDDVRVVASHAEHSIHLIETNVSLRESISYFGDIDVYVPRIISLLRRSDGGGEVLKDLLNGPIDCDKVDYLARDSLHSGVPYAGNLDPSSFVRLYRCLPDCAGIGIPLEAVPVVENFLILYGEMLANVYWNVWVRGIICMFHAALAHIVKEDAQAFRRLIRRLKACSSDHVALNRVLFPEIKKIRNLPQLQTLIQMHITQDFSAIYREFASFRHFDRPPQGKTTTFFARLVPWTPQSGTASNIPVSWEVVKKLRAAFLEEFKKQGYTAQPHEILIDVPTGKDALPRIKVIDQDGKVLDMDSISHLKESVFSHPAIFASPIRVFISPKLYERSKSRRKVILEGVTDTFLS